MERNEIVKALRVCGGTGRCVECPLGNELSGCMKSVMTEAVGLIEKQDVEIKALRGAASSMKAALSAMEQDLRQAVSGLDCELCAHFCNDGKPVYRPDEGYLAYCEKCGGDFCCFEWRGIQGTIPEEDEHGEIRKS